MLDALWAALQEAADDPAVKVVRIGGAGNAFCSGMSINEEVSGGGLDSVPESLVFAANRVVATIVALPKPVVAVIHGPAVGIGVSFALACDVALASEQAYFLLAFTKIGLMPDGGATAVVAAHIGRARAMRMALLGERLSAGDAAAAGLIAGTYAETDLRAQSEAIIDVLASGPAAALRRTKSAVNAATLHELPAAFTRETEGQVSLLVSHDFTEGVNAFRQRRTAQFKDA
jgi:enoyl-CoA hydratase